MTIIDQQIELFREKLDITEAEKGFLVDYSGCDEPCCGGCTHELNEDKIEAFLKESMLLQSKQTAERICSLIDDIEYKHDGTSSDEWKQYKRIRNVIRDVFELSALHEKGAESK